MKFPIKPHMLYCCALIIVMQITSSNQQECGMRQNRRMGIDVKGVGSAKGDWPWHAAIFHRKGVSQSYVCGGTLVSKTFVLTAAHCVLSTDHGQQLVNNRIVVKLGIHDLNSLDTQGQQQHLVDTIHKFPKFTRRDLKNDIALLRLSTEVEFTDFVQPACVNQVSDLSGEFGTLVGWGHTEDDEISSTLKSAQMPVIEASSCLKSDRELFGVSLDRGTFCAGYRNGTAICSGDSGGGMVFERNEVWYVAGIVSYTQSRDSGSRSGLCHTKSFGAFTKVQAFLGWIGNVTGMQFAKDGNIFSRCKPQEFDPAISNVNLLPRSCGVYIPNRIFGGQKAKVFEFPWMAMILDDELAFICGGSLINKRYVLTAARCVDPATNPSKVRLGEHTIGQERDCNAKDDYDDCAPPVREFGIECIVRHQNYTVRTRQYDIALIRLDTDVVIEDHIQQICLPVIPALRQLQPTKYTVAGWGLTEAAGGPSSTLMKATIQDADRSKCQEWMDTVNLRRRYNMSDSQICAGGQRTTDTCQGDTGGPLGWAAMYNGMRFIQFGITSFGIDCGGSKPAVYTRVASFMDWILANLEP